MQWWARLNPMNHPRLWPTVVTAAVDTFPIEVIRTINISDMHAPCYEIYHPCASIGLVSTFIQRTIYVLFEEIWKMRLLHLLSVSFVALFNQTHCFLTLSCEISTRLHVSHGPGVVQRTSVRNNMYSLPQFFKLLIGETFMKSFL